MLTGRLCVLSVRGGLDVLAYAGECRVDEDTSAVFANDDFLVHLDFYLTLCRDAVETSTAGVTLYVNNAQTVAGVATDALKSLEQTRLDFLLESLSRFEQLLLVLLCLGDDFVQLAFLLGEDVGVVLEQVLGAFHFSDGVDVEIPVTLGR